MQENPDLPPEELERLLKDYEDMRKPVQQVPPSQSSMVSQFEKRTPIRPRESMKEILFSSGMNNMGLELEKKDIYQNHASKVPPSNIQRNNANFMGHDNYNYFKDQWYNWQSFSSNRNLNNIYFPCYLETEGNEQNLC